MKRDVLVRCQYFQSWLDPMKVQNPRQEPGSFFSMFLIKSNPSVVVVVVFDGVVYCVFRGVEVRVSPLSRIITHPCQKDKSFVSVSASVSSNPTRS